MNETRERRIRDRAYRLWDEEGRPDGRQHEHWIRACDLVQREGERPPGQDPRAGGAESAWEAAELAPDLGEVEDGAPAGPVAAAPGAERPGLNPAPGLDGASRRKPAKRTPRSQEKAKKTER